MKTLLLLVTLAFPVHINNYEVNLSAIVKALSEGDATTVGNYFDSNVELTLLEKQDVYDKAKATSALKDFFVKNKPRNYTAVHQGTSKGNSSHYTIGDLTTTSGNYRVYLYFKTSGSTIVIQEMRIEK
jgi:hypothetical protein